MKLKLDKCEIRDDFFWIKNRIYVSQNEKIYSTLIKLIHDSFVKKHVEKKITYNRVVRYYYWFKMTHIIDQYVKIYHFCKRTKIYRNAKQKLLNSLSISKKYFQNISMNFIVELSKCVRNEKTYEHIMMIIDKLFKKKKFIALNSLKIKAVMQTFLNWIWREKNYSNIVVFDREIQFISHFWKKLCKKINIKFKFSTTWHSKTNEQTKNVNANLKTYFRVFVNYKQNDWVDYLLITKFEVNSIKNATTSMKSFLITKSYLSRSKIEFAKTITIDNSIERRKIKNVDKLIKKLKNLKQFLKVEIKWTQNKQKKFVNAHRTSIFEFRIKNMMMLNVKFQITRRQSKSLDFKNLSSYRIIRKINDMTYELKLFATMSKIFSIFHSWLLHLNDDISLQNQKTTKSKSMKLENDEWKINEIMKFKIDKRKNDSKTKKKENCLRYLIKWTKHDNVNIISQWLNWTKIRSCSHVVVDFHHKNFTNDESHVSFVIFENWTSSS